MAIKKIANAFDHIVDTKRTLREAKLLRLMKHENVDSPPLWPQKQAELTLLPIPCGGCPIAADSMHDGGGIAPAPLLIPTNPLSILVTRIHPNYQKTCSVTAMAKAAGQRHPPDLILSLQRTSPKQIIAIRDILPPSNPKNFNDVYVISELMDTDLHQVRRTPNSFAGR